jgi:hypothetical protein
LNYKVFRLDVGDVLTDVDDVVVKTREARRDVTIMAVTPTSHSRRGL